MLDDILLPIDFSANTEYAVKQAIELTQVTRSAIHLLHVIGSNSYHNKLTATTHVPTASNEAFFHNEAMKKLKEWKRTIEETIPGCNVKTHLEVGSVHANIIDTAQKIEAQLIILGKEKNRGFFSYIRSLNPEEIAKLSGCPVLRIVNGASNSKIQHIVIPIRSFIPSRKIELLIVFSKMYRSKIHLVALQNKVWAKDEKGNALLDSYRLLTSRITNRIEYHLLKGSNLPKATLKYAASVGADMIFVNPLVETKMSMFTGRHIKDSLAPKSKLKIVYVDPYPAKYILNKD